MVRMTHPIHGVTHATGIEIEWNIKNGWKVEEENAAPQESAIDKPMPIREESLSDKYIVKFGKPPHHRMKPETIEAALKE